jgi:DNA-binding IclR family transcriptional regulator
MTMGDRTTFTIQSIERAAAVMRSFSEFEPELGVTELSQRLKLHKSTVSRILSTLQKEGFISQNTSTGKYRLGVGLISLAGVALGRVDVRGAAFYHLDDLVAQTQESASVSVLDGSESVIVLNKPSPKPVRYVNWIGRRLPLHCSSSGKVLLAAMSAERRAAILPRPLRKYTDATIVSMPGLVEELERVADRGYAIACEEYEQGYSAVAAPIYNHEGRVVGALSVSGPSFRLPGETLVAFTDILRTTAARISAEMGYKVNPNGQGNLVTFEHPHSEG